MASMRTYGYGVVVMAILAGCRESATKAEQSGTDSASRKTKTHLSGESPRGQSRMDQVWRKFGRSESRESNPSKEQLLARLEGLRKERYSAAGTSDFEAAIGQLAELDPALALSFFPVAEIRANEPGFRFAAYIIAEGSPDVLREWLKSELVKGPVNVRAGCLTAAMEALGSIDPRSAVEFYLANDWKGAGSSDTLNLLFSIYGAEDPIGGLAMARSKLKGGQLDQACYRLSLSSGQEDPSMAMDIASKIDDRMLRGLAMQGNLSKLFDSNPQEVVEKLKAMGNQDLQDVLSSSAGINLDGSLLQKLAKENPSGLVETISSVAPNSSNESLFVAAVDELSKSSPAEAMKVIESLPAGAAKRSMESTYYSRLASQDFDSAYDAASKLSDAESKASAYEGLGRVAGQKGLDQVMKASQELADRDKASFLSSSLPQVLTDSPKELSEALAANQLPLPGKLNGKIYADLGERLDNLDSGYAREWFEGLPTERKPEAIKGMGKSMIARDVVGFSKMLNEMPRDAVWESGVRTLIENIRRSDSEAAEQWEAQLNEVASKK